MKTLGIFGTSGCAREVACIAEDLGFRPLLIARSEDEVRNWKFALDVIIESQLNQYKPMRLVMGIGDGKKRKQLADKFGAEHDFPNLIHPSAAIGSRQRAEIEKCRGNLILQNAVITDNVRFGDFCLINISATVSHDCVVGSYVTLCPGVNVSGNVHIDDLAWLGAGCVINNGTNERKLMINKDVVIGSGAVVINDCDAGATYAGVPARKLK